MGEMRSQHRKLRRWKRNERGVSGKPKEEDVLRRNERDFLGGAVVKNPPANAGNTGLIPGLGRSTCHRATKPLHHNY